VKAVAARIFLRCSIRLGRLAFYPDWPQRAKIALGMENEFSSWSGQYGWLDEMQQAMAPRTDAQTMRTGTS